MKKKIRLAYIYRKCKSLELTNFYTNQIHFFFDALKRSDNFEMIYLPSDSTLDITAYDGRIDAILLHENANTGDEIVPDQIFGLEKLKVPVIAKIGDPWQVRKFDVKEHHEKYKIDGYFGIQSKDLVYRYYPKNYRYETIFYGIEPSLYQNLTPFRNRIKNKILNSGAIINKKFSSRFIHKLKSGDANPSIHYKLRTMCNELSYVDYTPTLDHEFFGDKYPRLLQKYCASIAATTDCYTMKYFEMPASGCLTFMEITDFNSGRLLGFEDGVNSIHINEKNYKEKFAEYISDITNPKWEEIASNGKIHALQNFSNDKGTDSLYEYISEFL